MAQRRFEVLDGLRGLAAIVIVQRHTNWWPIGWHFDSGYLAVDFFFMLSGFVIAHAYGARLLSGTPMGRFMWTRLVRLYPLYFLALAAAVLILGAKLQDVPLWGVVLSLVLLPNFTALHVEWMVKVSWSLAAELGANALYGWFVRQLSPSRLAIVTAAGAAALIYSAIQLRSLDGGWEGDTIWVGAARVWFAFSLGLAIHALLPRLAKISAPWPLCILALGLLLAAPAAAGPERIVVDLLIVMGAMPLLLITAANSSAGRFTAPVLLWLGEISYALYILQEPLRDLVDAVGGQLGINESTPLFSFAGMGVMLLTATLITRYADAPIRALLNTISGPTPVRNPATSPDP